MPTVRGGFDRPSTTAYDVASTIYGLDRLSEVTGEAVWRDRAAEARAWFEDRNPAGDPVYDRDRGRVADGIDRAGSAPNSGAESNIEAASALLDDAVASIAALDALLPLS